MPLHCFCYKLVYDTENLQSRKELSIQENMYKAIEPFAKDNNLITQFKKNLYIYR